MIFIDYVVIDRHCIRAEAEIPAGEGVILRKIFLESKGKPGHSRQLDMEKMRKTTLELIRVTVEDDAQKK